MQNLSTSAAVRYLIPGDEKPIYIASQGGADAQLSIKAKFEDVEVNIHDARCLSPAASLDREGFELHSHHSAIENFYLLSESQEFYEQELEELVLPILQGESLLVFDHTLRSDSAIIREKRQIREAAAIVHNDYTDASAHKRVRDLLSQEEAEEKLQKRFAIVNVWRSVAGPVMNSPLACCDAQSITETSIHASERRAVDRIGELELVSHDDTHKWFYFPEMQRDEVLLIKTFDSATDGRAKRAVHTAFENPLALPDAPARESMESRMLVFF